MTAQEHFATVEPDAPMTAAFCIDRIQGSARMDDAGRVHTFAGSVALAEALAAFTAESSTLRRGY